VGIDALKSFVLYLRSFNFMAGDKRRFVTEFAREPELSGFFHPNPIEMQSNRYKMKISKKIKALIFRKPAKQKYGLFWQTLIDAHRTDWEKARKKAENGPKILIGTSTGGHGMASPIESLLAVALTLRGANVSILLCDQFLPACSMALSKDFSDLSSFVNSEPPMPPMPRCPKCIRKGISIFQPLGLPINFYSQFITAGDLRKIETITDATPLDSIPDYRWKDIAVGEHALAGALRFFARGDLNEEPYAPKVLRRFFKAAFLATLVTDRLLKDTPFRYAAFHHGIYVPQGLLGEVARRNRVKVVNWIQAYRKQCFVFSHDDTYHHTMMTEPIDRWVDIAWNSKMDERLLEYLKSRWEGTRDWISFHREPKFDLQQISRETGVDFSKPTVGMLTNVMWDAQLHYPANAFPNMREWVLQTIAYFAKRSDLQLLIRVHPAELIGIVPSRQRVVDEIKTAFPTLPENVFIIPPESRVSTYAAMLNCNAVIIYGTKTGVELTSMGIPVIVAGEAWIRNKGITLDAESIKEYFDLLARLPLNERLDDAKTVRARKYAFHFFFRRMIPLEFCQPTGSWPPFRFIVNSLDELNQGHSKGLDVICEGILNGTDFIYPAEHYLDH